jgi:transcription elongation factor/antiterminator RfaH
MGRPRNDDEQVRDDIGMGSAGVLTKQMAAANNKAAPAGRNQSREPASAFPSLVMGERWYVVQTLPHRESRAQLQLAAQGFRTFLPRYAKTVRHARKLGTVSAPLFPRYLFVALDLDRHRWHSVNGTFGVAGLVMGDEFPLSVQIGVVESLAASCSDDGHVQLADGLAVGQAVRVLSGPFADMIGKLVRLDGGARVQVLLQLLGGEVPVSVARAALLPAQAA